MDTADRLQLHVFHVKAAYRCMVMVVQRTRGARAHCTGHIILWFIHCVCVLLDRSHGLIISKAPTTCQVRSVAAAQYSTAADRRQRTGQSPVFHSIPVQSSPVQCLDTPSEFGTLLLENVQVSY